MPNYQDWFCPGEFSEEILLNRFPLNFQVAKIQFKY